MPELKASPRNRFVGLLADALQAGKSGLDNVQLPVVGGLGSLLMGEYPELINEVAYYGPQALVKGGNAATGGLGTFRPDPRVLDLAGAVAGAPGAGRVAKTAANPLTYRDAFYQAMGPGVMSNVRSQSKKGGEIAESNGYFYKGGQFLPSTEAEPGKWKIGKKWVTSGSELVEPGVIEKQPTPFSRSIFQMINQLLEKTDNGFKFRNDVRLTDGSPFSTESTIRPGVKGIVGTDEYTYQQLLDQYNAGNRWVNLNFDEPTLRTIQIVPEKKGLLAD